ncbi:MAG: non-canonical purine NTP pyrophosphatase, partial [Thermodesulfovibrionales bacterium]
MGSLRGDDRRARFVCVIALVTVDGFIKTFKGTVEGRIADSTRGDNGFGYDPLFIPEGLEETFGELSPDVKDRMSHRARALTLLRDYLEGVFKKVIH